MQNLQGCGKLQACSDPTVKLGMIFQDGSQVVLLVKNSPANSRDARDAGLIPGSGRSPGRGNGDLLQFLPGKSHGQRSLAGYNPWGCKMVGHDLGTTQQQQQ